MSIIQMVTDIHDLQTRVHKIETSKSGVLEAVVNNQANTISEMMNKITRLEQYVRAHQKIISDATHG